MRGMTPRTSIGSLAAMLLAVGLLAVQSSGAPNPATETFTNIRTTGKVGGKNPFLVKPTLNAPVTVASPEHLVSTDPAVNSPGSLDGEGTATFSSLKSGIKLWGPAGIRASSHSQFNDHWTVVNPALTGQTGTMQLGFDLSGMTTVLDTNGNPVATDEFSSVGLIVDLNPHNTGNGTSLLAFSTAINPGPTQILATPNGPTVTAPFTFVYGSEFGVRVTLTVYAETDNEYLGFTFGPPYREFYGGGQIDSVTVDFLSTAELSAIAIPGDPLARVETTSLTDHSGVVTEIVPLPASLWLMLGGLGLLRRRLRR